MTTAPTDSPSGSPSVNVEQFHSVFFEGEAIKLLIDPDTGAIIEANATALDFYGYTRHQLTQMHIQEINQLSPEKVAQEMARARLKQKNIFQFRHRLANNEIRDVEVYSTPVEFDGTQYLLSFVHDITERLRIEQALNIRERQYLSTKEALQEGIVIQQATGEVIRACFLNQFREKRQGYGLNG